MPAEFRALTHSYHGLARVLTSQAKVGIAFDLPDPPQPPTDDYTAIWDTGATGSVISQRIVAECGLKPIGMTMVHTAGADVMSEVYLVSIYLPNRVVFPKVRVTLGNITGADMLIGMDIMGTGDFAVTNVEEKTTFSFRFPSIARIDYVEEANRIAKDRAANRAQRRSAEKDRKRRKRK